jgi:AcrR family transcriptional regulator
MRAELTSEIKDEARRQLAIEGAPALSLRAVTRELGMASSAIYRYFPSRDDLLTALIVDAYDAIGEAAEKADAGCRRDDYGGRWRAMGLAVRAWAVANPHEYALVYGSPVPGYRAPEATIGPASRVTLVMARMIDEAARDGALLEPIGGADLPPLDVEVLVESRHLADLAFPHAPDEVVVRSVIAWTHLFGMISFELFGHFHKVIEQVAPLLERTLLETGRLIGIPPPRRVAVPSADREGRTADGHRADPADGPDDDFYLI